MIKDHNGIQAVPSPPILLLLQQAQQSIAELREENERLKIKSDAGEKNNVNLGNDNATLVEAVRVSGEKLAASNAINDSLCEKLEAAEKDILKVSSAKQTCETDMKNAKKNHLQEIKQANAVIKSLEKGGKGFEKEIHNLRRNLETTRDTLRTLKTEHSSLKMNKNKLETKIRNLEKVVSQKDFKRVKVNKKENTDLNQNCSEFSDSTTSSFTMNMPCNLEPTSISSFPTMSGPSFTSMLSHWNPSPITPPLMPNSITTMITHCLRSPSPTYSLCSVKEYQEMIERIIERAFANLRWRPLDTQTS